MGSQAELHKTPGRSRPLLYGATLDDWRFTMENMTERLVIQRIRNATWTDRGCSFNVGALDSMNGGG